MSKGSGLDALLLVAKPKTQYKDLSPYVLKFPKMGRIEAVRPCLQAWLLGFFAKGGLKNKGEDIERLGVFFSLKALIAINDKK